MVLKSLPTRRRRREEWRAWHTKGTKILESTLQAVHPFRRQASQQVSDHWLTVIGFGLIGSAFFQLGLFWGLLITGVLFLLFEMKVSGGQED